VPIAIEESDYSQVKLWFDQLKDNGVVDFSRFILDTSNLLPNLRERIRTIRINDQALRLWDVSSVDEYIDSFLPKGGKCIKVPGYRQCLVGLAAGKTYFDYEESIITKKGNQKCLHTWVSVAPGCESSLSKVDICFVDMTARRKAEDELKAYVSFRSEVGQSMATASDASDNKEWYPIDSVAVPEFGLTLVYLADKPDEISLVADAKRICRPDIIIECRGQRGWFEKEGSERVKFLPNSLKPTLGTYIIPIESVPVDKHGEFQEGIHILNVGFDQSRLGPIISALSKSA
jgi:hypothetical protein